MLIQYILKYDFFQNSFSLLSLKTARFQGEGALMQVLYHIFFSDLYHCVQTWNVIL